MSEYIRKVQVIPYRSNGKVEILMLRTIPKRGEFWQCVTGKIEEGESDEEAALRELKEETGIDRGSILRVNRDIHSFTFQKNGKSFSESVLAVQVKHGVKVDLSHNVYDEHTAYEWVSADEAINRSVYADQKDSITRFLKSYSS